MAKGSNDVILRDRLQFDIDVGGNTSLVYGRIDLSDYVSIVENKGLAVKEVRFMLRDPSSSVGSWPSLLINPVAPGSTGLEIANVKVFATTTAYEDVTDVGTASPNVLCVYTQNQTGIFQNTAGQSVLRLDEWFGTPDLHPEGYDVVTDLLIGIACSGLTSTTLVSTTCELDIMLIAEPKKITQKDLTQMLTQAQDL